MLEKEHLASELEAAPGLDSQQARSAKPLLDAAFLPPPDLDGEKEKQVGERADFAQVPLIRIEELGASQQLLDSTITLALAVSEARLKTEDIRRKARERSSKAGVSEWEELSEALDGISLLDPSWESRTDFSEWLTAAIADLGRTREDAGVEAQRIVDQLSSGELERRDMQKMLNALRKLWKALGVCADACHSESRTHIGKIGQRVQVILEPFKEQSESSARPTASKAPDSEEKWDRAPPPPELDRKLSAESGNGDRERQKGRNGTDGLE